MSLVYFASITLAAAVAGGNHTANFNQPPANLVGDYTRDFSKADQKTVDAAMGFFQGNLHLGADGTFAFPDVKMDGFWRIQSGQLVLVYSGFLGTPYIKPDAVLKKAWPTSQLEGLVMDVKGNETLSLPSFGVCKGPFMFHKAPRRTTRVLVSLSQASEDGDAMNAFSTLKDEASERWHDILEVVKDPHAALADRRWATFFLAPKIGLKCETEALSALENLDISGLSEREARRLRSLLAQSISKFENTSLIPRFLSDGKKGAISPATLAAAIATSRYTGGVHLLEDWTLSPQAGVRESVCWALAKLDARTSLSFIRKLLIDGEPSVRVAANGAVLKLSPDSAEQKRAVDALVKLMTGVDLINSDVIMVLGNSQSHLAVPVLTRVLAASKDEYDRRMSAEELGQLGFRDALPALRRAEEPDHSLKLPSHPTDDQALSVIAGGFKDAKEHGLLRKTIVEAIWKIEHPVNPKPTPRASSGSFSRLLLP